MKMSYKTLGLGLGVLVITVVQFIANMAFAGSQMDDMAKIRDGEKLDTEE